MNQKQERTSRIAKMWRPFFRDNEFTLSLEKDYNKVPLIKVYNLLLLMSVNTLFVSSSKVNLYDTLIPALIRYYVSEHNLLLQNKEIKRKMGLIYSEFVNEKKFSKSKLIKYYISEDFGYNVHNAVLNFKDFSDKDIQDLTEFGLYIRFRYNLDSRISF